ncbi:MAG: hypothetical protein KKF89_01310, partial [Nanoarchaeota archaeon]|nr:hypothetical protein [Nanoarchaeota archaeon]
FGLGGLYAEELCLVSKIDKSAEKITLEQIRTLYTNLKIMFSKEIHANFIEDSGEILPFELQTFVSDKKTFFESFSQALDFHLSKEIIRNQNFVLEKKLSDEINKIKQIFEQQEQTIKGLEVSEKENQKKGELIYENYELVKKLLDDLNFARKNFSWNEIKDSVKNHKVIKLINDKEGTIVLELK